jgi:hypothetical protein
MAAAIDLLGPGARWQDADHARAGSGPAAIRGRGLTRLGQPDGISPSRMAEMLEVDKAGPKVRC